MNFTELKKLVDLELVKVKALITNRCHSDVPLIEQVTGHLLTKDCKLIRPLLAILSAKLAGYAGSEHLNIAAALEIIHTATLLHDDIIDNAALRRGQITANHKWGNAAAVLAGDFLLSKAALITANSNNMASLKIIAETTSIIAEGEMLQLANKNNLALTEVIYFQIIAAKTAKLFETAALLPTLLIKNFSATAKQQLAAYGYHLGLAFQLIDDLFDYQINPSKNTGKPVGQDLLEGNITLPIIYFLNNCSPKEKLLCETFLHSNATSLSPELQTAIASSDAITYTIASAQQEAALAKQALASFVDSTYKDAALALVDFIIARDY